MGKYLIDMHCHILPAVDDGSQSMETTKKMIEIAAGEGITHMIATPHFKKAHHNASPETVQKLVDEVQKMAEENGIDIRFFPGNEVMYFGDIEEAYEAGRLTPMNGSDYLMIEFYPDDDYARLRRGVETVQSLGFHPVLAHVERYLPLLSHPELVEELKGRGAYISVNASSAVGDGGLKVKSFVKRLLKKQLVDFIGTDAHHYESRAPRMKRCAEYLYKKYDERYVDKVLYGNAAKCFGIEL